MKGTSYRLDCRVLALALAALLAGAPALTAQENPAPQPASRPRSLVISLDDALRMAAGESETVWVAEAGVMRAVGNQRIARSGFFPQLNGTASYTRTLRSQFDDISFGAPDDGEGEEGAIDLPFGRENQYSLGLSLSQLIFDGGQTRARNRAAGAQRRSAEIGVDSAIAQTLLDVTQAYFDAQLGDRLVQIAEASLAQSEETLRITDVAFQVGDRAEFDVLRARVARDNQLPVLIRQRTERAEAYLRLKQLLEVPAEDDLVLTTGVGDTVPRFATASDASAEDRAPVRQAAETVAASEAQVDQAQAQRLPLVQLTSQYAPVAYPTSGLPGYDDFQEDWSVTLGLSIPILTWGRLRGNVMVAEGTLSEAQARLEQAREAAELEARIARNDLSEAEAALTSNTATVEQAERALQIAQVRFQEGISSQLELTDSRLLLEQAQVNRAQALRDVQVARARLALLRDLPLGAGSGGGGFVAPQQIQQTPTQQTPAQSTAAPSSGLNVGNVGGVSGAGSPLP
jgi:outer membrane protein